MSKLSETLWQRSRNTAPYIEDWNPSLAIYNVDPGQTTMIELGRVYDAQKDTTKVVNFSVYRASY